MKKRQDWFGAQLDLDPRKLVFIDETGASTNLARKGGRCRQGRRLRVGIPHGHYKTITLVSGLRLSGLVAQKAYDKPMNTITFEQWVEKCLVPTLSKGDVVVMDNLPSHKGPRVEQLIEPLGAQLRYLPPNSPDMSPIEKAFSKLRRCRETSESTGVRGYPGGVRRERGVRNFALSLFGGGGFPVSIGLSITAA